MAGGRPRTDLWGVGATMFRLLSGRLVHEAETANEAVIAAATLPAPALASIDGALSGIAEVVDKALRAAPGDRWQSVAEMRAAGRAMLAAFPDARFPTPRPVHEPTTLDESAPPDADGAGDAQPAIESTVAGAGARKRRRALALGLVAGGAVAIAAAVFTGTGRAPEAPATPSAPARAPSVAAAPLPRAAQPPAETARRKTGGSAGAGRDDATGQIARGRWCTAAAASPWRPRVANDRRGRDRRGRDRRGRDHLGGGAGAAGRADAAEDLLGERH